MAIIGSKFEKQDVFRFAREVKSFLNLLQGASIEADKNKLYDIEKAYCRLEKLIITFEPSSYEEYSNKVKILYNNMIKNRKEYDRVISEKCYSDVVEEYRNKYESSVKEYQKSKLIRNSIKEQLEKLEET